MAIMHTGKGYPDKEWSTHTKVITPPDPFALLRPFLHSWTVGFDDQFTLLEQLRKDSKSVAYPPYNIREVSDDKFEIEMAVAGFSKSDIVLTIKEGVLMVEGGSKESKSDNYIHKGIAARTFEQKFALGEYVEVKGATMENGILTIFLEREIPEEKKPKIITIK